MRNIQDMCLVARIHKFLELNVKLFLVTIKFLFDLEVHMWLIYVYAILLGSLTSYTAFLRLLVNFE